MATTLTYSSTTITLHDDMLWTDEFAHRDVVMTTARTIAGSLIVESAAQTKGRPISLSGGQNYGWLPRSVVLQLQTAANIVGQKFTLNLRGTSFTVQFDHTRTPLTATPVIEYGTYEATDMYVVGLQFIEVDA